MLGLTNIFSRGHRDTHTNDNEVMDDITFEPTLGQAEPERARFPDFPDGDVKIIISGARHFQLHKIILTGGSPTFRKLLSEEYTTELSKKAKKRGAVITNQLRPSETGGRNGLPEVILKPVKLNDEGRYTVKEKKGLDMENGLYVRPVYEVGVGATRGV